MKLFLGLGLLTVFLLAASYASLGAEFKEPTVGVCYEKAPARWHEAIHAEARVTPLPPRIRCDMVNTRTGESATWDSGSASLPAFVLAVLAGLGAVTAAVWSIRSGVRAQPDGRTRRSASPLGR
jgi:hypothetical protein